MSSSTITRSDWQAELGNLGVDFSGDRLVLPRSINQARGIAAYACAFLSGLGKPSAAVQERAELFIRDALLCGASAWACKPHALVALAGYVRKHCVGNCSSFGHAQSLSEIGATLLGCASVRMWDSNGTNFGYREEDSAQQAGEFGHNDFAPAVIAAAQALRLDGATVLQAIIALDEIRNSLACAYSLKSGKIDHVLHGGVATAAVIGALRGLSIDQIEWAIGYVVSHHVPFRCIRHGNTISHSKGASAAITAKAAYEAVLMAEEGFNGTTDVFCNSEAVYWQMLKGQGRKVVEGESPFDLILPLSGDDFGIMGMHFKLGVYEHQSAGALQALITLLQKNPQLGAAFAQDHVADVLVKIYGTAHHIISQAEKWSPANRESADHSMPYILNALINNAIAQSEAGGVYNWKTLMILPHHYSVEALREPRLFEELKLIRCEHEPAYDPEYPRGIPTSVVVTLKDRTEFDSGLVMYPGGHARNALGETPVDLLDILTFKHEHLARLAVGDDAGSLLKRFQSIGQKSADEIAGIFPYSFAVHTSIDG